MSWRRRVTCPVDGHSLLTITPEQCAALRYPAIFVVPHEETNNSTGRHGSVVVGRYKCLDFPYPGPGVCPFCGIIPSDVCFWDFLPFSAHNAPDRLFISSSAVGVDAAGGIPPDASTTLTLGVGYSLVSGSVPHLSGEAYVTQFRLFEGQAAQVRLFKIRLCFTRCSNSFVPHHFSFRRPLRLCSCPFGAAS